MRATGRFGTSGHEVLSVEKAIPINLEKNRNESWGPEIALFLHDQKFESDDKTAFVVYKLTAAPKESNLEDQAH